MTTLIKKMITSFVGLAIATVCEAQVSTLGNGFPGGAADFCGWDATRLFPVTVAHQGNFPINFQTNAIQRMTIVNTTGFVGIGTGFANPVSLLHLHQPAGNNVFLRFSNAGTGGTNIDGFVVGMLNGTVNGDACLIQYEPNPVRFFIPDINAPALISPEKMQLTWGGQMEGGTADGLRIFNPGYPASVPNAVFNAIDICTGIGNSTHIRLDNSGNLDTEQLLFKESARFNGFWFNAAPTATQYPGFRARYIFNIDSVEVMRIGSALGMGANVPGPGPTPWNVNEGFVRIGEQPNVLLPVNAGNRLEIDAFPNTTFATPNPGCAGSTGFSGLRLTDLTSASLPCTTAATTNVLSVDANGDVILIPGVGTSVPFFSCGTSDAGDQLPSDSWWELNGHNFVFDGQTGGTDRVGIGTTCTPAAKLDVLENNSGIGIKSLIVGSSGCPGTPDIAGWFEAPSTGGKNIALFCPQGQVSFGYSGFCNTSHNLEVSGTAFAFQFFDFSGWNSPSDVQLKTDTASYTHGLDYIRLLNIKTYRYNGQGGSDSNKPHIGIFANDIQNIPDLAPYVLDTMQLKLNPSDPYMTDVLTINSGALAYTAINAIKQLDAKVDSMSRVIETLNSVVSSCCNNNARTSGQANNEQNVTLTNSESIVLNQNVPNPFAEQTTITYRLPESVVKAQMMFYDVNGKLIQVVDLDGRGEGQLNVFADDLSNGIYTYALIADGEVIDSKQMVKSK